MLCFWLLSFFVRSNEPYLYMGDPQVAQQPLLATSGMAWHLQWHCCLHPRLLSVNTTRCCKAPGTTSLIHKTCHLVVNIGKTPALSACLRAGPQDAWLWLAAETAAFSRGQGIG